MVKKLLQVVAPGKSGDRRNSFNFKFLLVVELVVVALARSRDVNVTLSVTTKSETFAISTTSDGKTI